MQLTIYKAVDQFHLYFNQKLQIIITSNQVNLIALYICD